MIEYFDTLENISAADLAGGFFEGWKNPPSPQNHLKIMQAASSVIIARENKAQVVGFMTALSDGISSVYFPMVEVLAAYRKQGIGSRMVNLMLEKYNDIYMVDLICDPELEGWYRKFGLTPTLAMAKRNYAFQASAHTRRKGS